jgi:single-stranded-DNA-specific exonuclease
MLTPVERVDAVVSGSELGLALAEELRVLEPCGVGNPRPSLLVPGARFSDQRPLGDGGRHVRFVVASAGARARAVAFGCEGRVPGGLEEPVDATFKLERNEWRGIVEPRLVLRHAQPCAVAKIEVLGEPGDYLQAALEELDAQLEVPEPSGVGRRTVIDRRGSSPLAVLGDALSTAQPVLAVCADVPRRLEGLSTRTGGFALISYHALERDATASVRFPQLVALDPPAGAAADSLLRAGDGVTHLAWGDAELRFAWQIHELEYGLRASLAALYRGLKHRGAAAGEELEHLLRGDGQYGRPARLAGRLVRVLAELELVSLDRDLPGLAVAGEARTALERSAAYRAYERRHEDGRRYLSSAKLPPRSG